jgi:hypothetical protein
MAAMRAYAPDIDVQGLRWLRDGTLDDPVFQHLVAKVCPP